jgi:hypothetical protein
MWGESQRMAKKFCDFKRDYFRENGLLCNSYFNYVELENYACWIMAEVNSAADRDIMMLLTDKILNNFKERPTVSQRDIRRYLREAIHGVANRKRDEEIRLSLALAVTDYTRILLMVTGDEWLFCLRSRSRFVKKDGFWQLHQSGPDRHNHFFEDCACPEEHLFFGLFRVKKARLHAGDVIILCNSEVGKAVTGDEIYYALNGVKEPPAFLEQLQTRWLPQTEKAIHNYQCAAIFIYHIFDAGRSDYRKKLWAGITLFLLMTLYLIAKPVIKPTARPSLQIRQDQPKVIKSDLNEAAAIHEQEGDRLADNEAYAQALVEYRRATDGVDSANSLIDEPLQKKIRIMELINSAERLAATEEWYQALTKYQAAHNAARAGQLDAPAGLQRRIASVQAMLHIQKLVAQGDRQVAKKNFAAALDDYTKAQNLALDAGCDTIKFGLESKIKKVAGIVMDDLALQKLTRLQAERERQERQKLIKEQQERERLAQERREQERLAQEKQEQERLAQERREQERLAQEKQERERLAQERREQERLAQEKQEQERLAQERREQERLAQEKQERERLAQERREQERLAQEKQEQERLAQERQEQESPTQKKQDPE